MQTYIPLRAAVKEGPFRTSATCRPCSLGAETFNMSFKASGNEGLQLTISEGPLKFKEIKPSFYVLRVFLCVTLTF